MWEKYLKMDDEREDNNNSKEIKRPTAGKKKKWLSINNQYDILINDMILFKFNKIFQSKI